MGEYFLLQPKRRAKVPKTTNSNHKFTVYANEVKHLGKVIPGWVWVSDITYVWIGNKWVYLALIMDQAGKKIVGFAMSKSIDTELVMEALNMALRENKAPLYHHSDRGVQYCSFENTNKLKEHGIKISMADVGMSVDNAYAESLNRSIKVEEVYLNAYETFEEAKESIGKYILRYNTKRLHSSLGYMSPLDYEKKNNYQLNISKVDDLAVSI